jgi:hypothetical protein
MSSMPSISRVALAAGIPARYLYWTGHSGRRYLFTCMSGAAAAELESGVAIAVSGERIVWTGQVGELAMLPSDAPARRAAIYVHLLATTLAERRGIVWDLRPVEVEDAPVAEQQCHLRLAA